MLQGTERALRVIEVVSELQPIGVGELSRLLGVPKSTMQRTLQTLADADWIASDGGPYTRWRLTTRALRIGRRAASSDTFRSVALAEMARIRDAIDVTVTLQVRDGFNRMVLAARVDPDQPVSTSAEIGSSTPMSVTSGGIAYLAALGDEEVEAILADPLEKITDATVTDPEVIWRNVHAARTAGFAVNLGQNREGVRAVAAVVLDTLGRPAAAIGISVPEFRFDQAVIEDLGALVRCAAAAVSIVS